MSSLLFIDTNIYLDFYRFSNDVSLSLLKRVDDNRNIVITTEQVEMEFKKNRQGEILKALAEIKPQNSAQLNVPSFLKESKYKGTSKRLIKEWDNFATKLILRTEKLLESPGRYDPVYKILQRLFKEKGACHLTCEGEIWVGIEERAQKRFNRGCPPRKPNDTSIGDAINWEWMIHCAKELNNDIVIISRDKDYGQPRKNGPIINDWLLQEFRKSVGLRRTITLTPRLAEGFRLAGITIPKDEEQAEQKFIEAETQAIPKFEPLQRIWTITTPVTWMAAPVSGMAGATQVAPVVYYNLPISDNDVASFNPQTAKVTSPSVDKPSQNKQSKSK
jgi:hypothetical protein